MSTPLLQRHAQVKKQRQPLHVALGTFLLFGVFLALLAGRFSLARLSPALPDVDLRIAFVYVLGVAAMVWYYGAREYLPRRVQSGAVGVIFFWLGWLGFTVGWSPAGARVGEYMTDLFAMAFFLGLAFALIGFLPAGATGRIWSWMFYTGIIYLVLAFATGADEQGRFSAPGGGPNVFVRIMILAALAAFFISATRGKRWPMFLVPLFAVGAALSGSRGGMVAAAIVLFIAAVPIARRLGAGKVAALVFVSGTAAVIAYVRESPIAVYVEERFIQQTLVERYSSGRDAITEQAMDMFNAHPFFGVGLDGYYALMAGGLQYEYPHNLVLASAAEGGIVGLLILGLALLVLLRAATRVRPLPPAVFFPLVAGMFVFFASPFSGDYYDTRFMWFFLGWAAIEAARPATTVTGPAIAPSRVRSP